MRSSSTESRSNEKDHALGSLVELEKHIPVMRGSDTTVLHRSLCQWRASAIVADNIIGMSSSPAAISKIFLQVQTALHGLHVHVLEIHELERRMRQLVSHIDDVATLPSSVYVQILCLVLRDFVMLAGPQRFCFVGFPRHVEDARAFASIGTLMDHVMVLHEKKDIGMPHSAASMTDEDYYSSDEEEKQRKKHAPEPPLSQLHRYYETTHQIPILHMTFVENKMDKIYPALQSVFTPCVVLAIGNQGSPFWEPLTRAAHRSEYLAFHVPTLLKNHMARFPESDTAATIATAFAQNRLVPVEISLALVQAAFHEMQIARGVILSGFPRLLGHTLPYIQDQLSAITSMLGPISKVGHPDPNIFPASSQHSPVSRCFILRVRMRHC